MFWHKVFFLLVLAALLFVIGQSFLPHFSVFGVVVDLLFLFAFSLSFFSGRKIGVLSAVFCGFLLDMAGSGGFGVFILSFLVLSLAAGEFGSHFQRNSAVVFVFCLAICFFLVNFLPLSLGFLIDSVSGANPVWRFNFFRPALLAKFALDLFFGFFAFLLMKPAQKNNGFVFGKV
ncbi:MAG: rod shape-determining protein MreD [Patescibacteria group bacterium]|nr:rod shape-determining protein MreD [Patescibacteria group bacterium]